MALVQGLATVMAIVGDQVPVDDHDWKRRILGSIQGL